MKLLDRELHFDRHYFCPACGEQGDILHESNLYEDYYRNFREYVCFFVCLNCSIEIDSGAYPDLPTAEQRLKDKLDNI